MSFSNKVESGLTIDKIIEKFIPVVGAILFTIGLGYLLYKSAWVNFPTELKLGIGFFTSLVIIGTAFSFSEKLAYFADVVMGGGILLLYGTLIYGSRVTEAGEFVITEVATLVASSIFTVAVAYFASLRKSKIILAIALLGSYLTPFVIGGEWGTSVLSFNSYLIYFLVANVSIFLLGRELALRDLVPLNMMGLFFGTSSLYYLSYKTVVLTDTNLFSSTTFSAIIIFLLVVFSVFSVVISSEKFESKDESFITTAYILPLVWFIVNINLLGKEVIGVWYIVALYSLLSVSYFFAWRYVRNMKYKFQHVSLYVAGIISLVFAFVNIFPNLDYLTSTIIAYIGLFFAGLFFYDSEKWERYFTYLIFAIFGGVMSFIYFYDGEYTGNFGFVYMAISLFPILVSYPILKNASEKVYKLFFHISVISSISALITIIVTMMVDIIDLVSVKFMLGVLPALLLVTYAQFGKELTINQKSTFLRFAMFILFFGFFTTFSYLLVMLVPGSTDSMSLLGADSILKEDIFLIALFAIITMFMGLNLSRKLQIETKESRPSFILVVFAYASLILLVNYILMVLINDLGVPTIQGGYRAVTTTVWWVVMSSLMLTVGLYRGKAYRSEKLLGLILFFVTVGKIIIYDFNTMNTEKKVIMLMIVGGLLMGFSYFFHTKNWFKGEEN